MSRRTITFASSIMSPFVCSKLSSISQPTPLVGAFILAVLVIVIVVSINLMKGKKTRKLKLPSKTSSFIITRFKNQKPKEEPYMAFNLPCHDEHKGLSDVGAWTAHDEPSGTPHDWNNTTLASMQDLHTDMEMPLVTVQQ